MARQPALEPAPRAAERFSQAALLGMLASGYCAVLGSGALDHLTAALGGMALLARALHLARIWRLIIPVRWVNIATVAYLAFFPLDYYFFSRGFTASIVHLVVFVAAVKLLTAASRRDHLLLLVVAFLELLAASMLSVNLSFFVCLTAFLIFAVAAFAGGEIVRASEGRRVVARPNLRLAPRLLWLTACVSLGIAAITAVLFIVLPRTARAALERFASPGSRVSGFATEVTLGQLGDLHKSSRPVMHVRFDVAPSSAPVKWRGAALAEFNGWKWFNSYEPPTVLRTKDGLLKLADDDQLRRAGPRAVGEVLLHMPPSDALFVAGLPEHLRLSASRVLRTRGGRLHLTLGDETSYHYYLYSYLGGPADSEYAYYRRLPGSVRDFYVRLPPVDRRILELAQDITRGIDSDSRKAAAIESYLRTNYAYSLAPLEREVEDPLADFLFRRRKGHCEYFASAMAVMLRAVWIPSRVVTGFQNGSYNPLTGWTVVRASDAHSWVEAWIPGQGWMTFDPTPAGTVQADAALWSRLALWTDALDILWQEWVVGYDADRQMMLAFRVGESSQRLSLRGLEPLLARFRALGQAAPPWPPAVWISAMAALAALLLLLPSARRWADARSRLRRAVRGQASPADATLLYQGMLRLLRHRGYFKSSTSTPLEFARSLPAPLALHVSQFTSAYNELRFARRSATAARLASLLVTIEQFPR